MRSVTKGFTATFARDAVASMFYFSTYEFLKRKFADWRASRVVRRQARFRRSARVASQAWRIGRAASRSTRSRVGTRSRRRGSTRARCWGLSLF